MSAVEESGDPVALQAAEAHFLSEHEVQTSDGVGPEGEFAVDCAQELFAELRRDSLIGIDDEDPVMAGAIDGVVLLRRCAQILALFEPNPWELLAYQLDRAVRRERIDEVDLVRPVDGTDAILNVFDFVERVKDRGDRYPGHRRGFYDILLS